MYSEVIDKSSSKLATSKKVENLLFSSYLRTMGFWEIKHFWAPVLAGVMALKTFYGTIKVVLLLRYSTTNKCHLERAGAADLYQAWRKTRRDCPQKR